MKAVSVQTLIAGTVLLVSVLVVGTTAATIIGFYSPLQFQDQWAPIEDLYKVANGTGSLFERFMTPHSEHRITLPRLFFYADLVFFGGRDILNLITIQAIQLIHVALLWWALVHGKAYSPAQKATYLGLVLIAMYSAIQMENFIWGFQVQFVGVFALATGALVAASQSVTPAGELNLRPYLAAFMCAIAAVFTMANGILVWPLLLIFWFCIGMRGANLYVTSFLLLGGIALFFATFNPVPHHSNPYEILNRLANLATFFFVYIGGPLARGNLATATVVGLAGVLTFLAFIAQILWNWRKTGMLNHHSTLLAMIGLFILGTAFITALGRSEINIGLAFSNRYATGALVFWLTVSGLILAHPWSNALKVYLGRLTIACVFSAIVIVHFKPLDVLSHFRNSRDQTAIALLNDVYNPALLLKIFPNAKVILPWIAFLKERKASIFSEKIIDSQGQNIREIFQISSPDACIGKIEGLRQIHPSHAPTGTFRVAGSAFDTASNSAPNWLLLTDENNIVSGVGMGMKSLPSPRITAIYGPDKKTKWVGYFTRSSYIGKINVYALLSDGLTICKIGDISLD